MYIQERTVFFLVATYGDGEPTDNAAKFYDWLVKSMTKAEEDVATSELCKVRGNVVSVVYLVLSFSSLYVSLFFCIV